MSYNILADQYAQVHLRELYSSVPRHTLEWGTRAALISKEVAHWAPDVVCFQEVDHYSHLESLLERHGYKGSFEQRTGGRADGLAMFWKAAKFGVEARRRIEFATLGLKDNVAQLMVLRCRGSDAASCGRDSSSDAAEAGPGDRVSKHTRFDSDGDEDMAQSAGGHDAPVPDHPPSQPGPCLVVANIHVLFNPKRGDIKIAQVRTMLQSAARLATSGTARHGVPCPVIVCGDFNSAAGSALYEFVVRGELDLRSTDRRRVSGQVEVAGRTGWPAIQKGFMAALKKLGCSEEEAMAAAVGGVPPYSSVTDPHSSLFEPRLLTLDSSVAALHEPDPVLAELQRSDSDLSSVANGHGSGRKKSRPWAEEELRLAVGEGESGAENAASEHGASPCGSVVRHPLRLRSAYQSVAGAEPLYTTAHDKFLGTVDYIFYTPEAPHLESGEMFGGAGLRPLSVLKPPPLRTLQHGLPCTAWPSDHVCLVADFALTARSD